MIYYELFKLFLPDSKVNVNSSFMQIIVSILPVHQFARELLNYYQQFPSKIKSHQ